jgi:hypothetical protein
MFLTRDHPFFASAEVKSLRLTTDCERRLSLLQSIIHPITLEQRAPLDDLDRHIVVGSDKEQEAMSIEVFLIDRRNAYSMDRGFEVVSRDQGEGIGLTSVPPATLYPQC